MNGDNGWIAEPFRPLDVKENEHTRRLVSMRWRTVA